MPFTSFHGYYEAMYTLPSAFGFVRRRHLQLSKSAYGSERIVSWMAQDLTDSFGI